MLVTILSHPGHDQSRIKQKQLDFYPEDENISCPIREDLLIKNCVECVEF